MGLFSTIHAKDPVINDNPDIKLYTLNFKNITYRPYTRLHHSESAIRRLSIEQKAIIAFILVFFAVASIFNLRDTAIFVMGLVTLLYFSDLLFKFYLVILSLKSSPEIVIGKDDISKRSSWPIYSIICPLYNEAHMLKQFSQAIRNLDYPADKLQILLTLEEEDTETLAAVKKLDLPKHFHTLIVPHDQPKTKPKACNFALHHAKGEYIVIYDAEDIPEKDQLKKAVLAFEKVKNDKVVCIQAKLNYYNPNQNLLTRVFTLEYSEWFDLILTGLHHLDVPIPLSGTSNHFKKESLMLLHG